MPAMAGWLRKERESSTVDGRLNKARQMKYERVLETQGFRQHFFLWRMRSATRGEHFFLWRMRSATRGEQHARTRTLFGLSGYCCISLWALCVGAGYILNACIWRAW